MRLIFASEERALIQRAVDAEAKLASEQSFSAHMSTVFTDLLAKYHALKLTGAAPATTPTKRPTDRVLEVIADVAGSNAPLRSMLGRYARQQRAKKVDDDQIIATLMHWPDADEDSQTDDMST